MMTNAMDKWYGWVILFVGMALIIGGIISGEMGLVTLGVIVECLTPLSLVGSKPKK